MCSRWSIQERKITDTEGSGIFDLEENKVDTIGKNLPPWVEVEEALEGAEDMEVAEAQEEEDASMHAEENIPLPSRRNKIQSYKNI